MNEKLKAQIAGLEDKLTGLEPMLRNTGVPADLEYRDASQILVQARTQLASNERRIAELRTLQGKAVDSTMRTETNSPAKRSGARKPPTAPAGVSKQGAAFRRKFFGK